MGLFTWLKEKFSNGSIPLSGANLDLFIEEYASTACDVCFREMAFWSAVNLIANAISKCEFKTFMGGKEVKGEEYYLWNIEPNQNQNSSEFIHQWIAQLLRKNECLIVENGGKLYVADSFAVTPYALYEDTFTQVTVKNFTFNRSFVQSEVLYFKLSEQNMRQVANALFDSYSKLLEYSMKAYQKSRGTKGIFSYETLPVTGTPERAAFDALINDKIGKWLNGDNAALPLGKGQSWKELEHKTYSNESTRDIRAQIDDISDFTAKCYGIPTALLRGDVQGTKDAVDNFLTFCIDPLVDMLQEEINRKRNGYSGMSKGNYLKIDTKQIRHVDVLSVSTAVDKLIGSGAFCINDIRVVCGEQIIDEPWAWQHYVTKNYEAIEAALTLLKGGGGDDG
jgi:HK97 family phage portal protein